jgi:hypothetical protein
MWKGLRHFICKILRHLLIASLLGIAKKINIHRIEDEDLSSSAEMNPLPIVKYLDFVFFRKTYPPHPPPFRQEELGSFWAFSFLRESSSLDPWAPRSKEGGCQRISFEKKYLVRRFLKGFVQRDGSG